MRQVVEALKDGTKVAPTATGSVRLKGGLKEVPEPPAFSGRTIQTTEEFISACKQIQLASTNDYLHKNPRRSSIYTCGLLSAHVFFSIQVL